MSIFPFGGAHLIMGVDMFWALNMPCVRLGRTSPSLLPYLPSSVAGRSQKGRKERPKMSINGQICMAEGLRERKFDLPYEVVHEYDEDSFSFVDSI